MRTIFLFALMVMIPTACSAKLISHWPFNGDSSNTVESSKFTAKDYGPVAFTDGLFRQALDLTDPKDAALIVENTDSLNDLKVFSVSLWVKLDTKYPNVFSSIVSKNGEGNQGWQIRTHRNHGFAGFVSRGKDGNASNCYGGLRVDDGKWHHLVAVYDGQFSKIYVNGHLADLYDAPPEGIGRTDSPLAIGAKVIAKGKKPYRFFKGKIDELMLFDHVLSPKEIKDLSDSSRLLRAEFSKRFSDRETYPVTIHRGAGKYEPENTIEAFEYAWTRNLIPEADIRRTKDNVIVCFHDDDLKRLVPSAPSSLQEKGIDDLTLEKVKTFDVGEFRGKHGQKIPTLAEVFEVMSKDPTKLINLDYKTFDMNLLAEMVKKNGIEKQVIFTTKNYDLIRRWRQLVPKAPAMIWMNGSQETMAEKMNYLRENDFKGIFLIQLHYKPCGDSFQLSDKFILDLQSELKAKNIFLEIMPWDIEDRAVYERLFQIGIESMSTDYPDVLLPLCKKYLGPPKPASNQPAPAP